jgi:hemolysin D
MQHVTTLVCKNSVLEPALSFQGDLVRLVEEPLPRGIRSTMYYCVLLTLVCLFVSIALKVDVVVQGPGKLTYDAPPVVLHAFERAILRGVHVKPGERVEKDQRLATLDPTFAQADLAALEDRKRLIRAQVRRLESEAFGKAFLAEPSDGQAGTLQAEIQLQRANEYKFRMRAFSEAIDEAGAALSRIDTERSVLQQQLSIAASIEAMQESLLKAKTNSQLEFLSAKGGRLKIERDFRDAADRLVEKRHQLEAAQAQKESFVQQWRRSLLEELTTQRAEESQVDAAITKAKRINSLIVICAPADGVVLDIANLSVGSVLRETEALVVIAPTEAPLLCEMELGSSGIGDVAVGDPVLIKVDAFPYQRYGGLEGKIRSISQESHSFGGGAMGLEAVANKRAMEGGFHRVTVELPNQGMAGLPDNRRLFPGMTASGEVHVGKRRLINYVLDPLLKGLRESFREP